MIVCPHKPGRLPFTRDIMATTWLKNEPRAIKAPFLGLIVVKAANKYDVGTILQYSYAVCVFSLWILPHVVVYVGLPVG